MSLMFKLNEFFKIVNMLFCTMLGYVVMFLWGIKYGKCKFWGRTFFQRYKNSSIIIGYDCEFRSNHKSNQIGVYSPCMISTLKEGASIVIGDHCGMSGCVIGCAHSIVIGSNVRIGANTLITDTDWHSSDNRIGNDKPVIIKDNVWLGYGVKVLKGVTIGENSLIGLGSVVTHDIPSNSIAAGNPCKVIRKV